jgi:delta24-sterol reductase
MAVPELKSLDWLKEVTPDPKDASSSSPACLLTSRNAGHSHARSVAAISARVHHFYTHKIPFRIFHGSTNSTRSQAFQPNRMVDTSGLNHVLDVNTAAKTALVEPNVPMDELVKILMPFGLVPPVVMEFPGITVGGGFAGTSGESSSFRHGFFDRNVNWIEIVLGNGDVVRASRIENQDLFYGAAGSFGTLGVTTLLELKLVDTSFWVKLTYWPVDSVSDALSKIKTFSEDEDVDYLDGILYSSSSGIVITGKRTDEKNLNCKVTRFTRNYDPWFYLHAQSVITASPKEPTTQATVLTDYLFRYDRGAFWTGAWAFKYFLVPFNRWTRCLLDYFMHTRVMYHALHESGLSEQYIIQDLALPLSAAQDFISWVDTTLSIYPLWLCPLRPISQTSSFHPKSAGSSLLINIGVWGPGPHDPSRFEKVNRDLEHKVRELKGMKWLYAHAYYTEEEFWDIYDKSWYDALRAKYHATSLPSVYEKVKTNPRETTLARRMLLRIWPMAGLYGVLKAFLGGNYLVKRRGFRFRHLLMLLGIFVACIAVLMSFISAERIVEAEKMRER